MEQKTEKTYLKLIIEDQMERHAGFRIQDLYKCFTSPPAV